MERLSSLTILHIHGCWQCSFLLSRRKRRTSHNFPVATVTVSNNLVYTYINKITE